VDGAAIVWFIKTIFEYFKQFFNIFLRKLYGFVPRESDCLFLFEVPFPHPENTIGKPPPQIFHDGRCFGITIWWSHSQNSFDFGAR
jgi:hypothetical protein